MPYKPRAVAGTPLTPREIDVMWLVAEGQPNKIVADRLGIAQHTAKFHIANAVTKLGTTSRVTAAVRFILSDMAVARRDEYKLHL